MKSAFAGAFGLFVFWATSAQAAISYVPIGDTNVVVTGVRSDSATSDSVVLTANYATTEAALYEGSLAASQTAPNTSWHVLTPVFGGQTVTAATFYGPNTALFEPSLGTGNVIAVGSYKYAQGSSGPNADHGLLYQGPVAGGGTWTQIDAAPLIDTGNGETLLNTIAHSNMGDLVVGNYDTSLTRGKAFIYNRVTQEWVNLNPAGSASVTAYGIWQNGGSLSTSYTIAGGFSDVTSGGADEGYIVNYNSVTHAVTNFKIYNFKNLPKSSLVSHFDGITASAAGFNLTGDAIVAGGVGPVNSRDVTAGEQAFFASVKVNPDGSFGEAAWTQIVYPGSAGMSGNTVVANNALGIFVSGGATQSYIATVAQDRSVAVTVAKSGTKATFTIANTGDTTGTFDLSRVIDVTNSYSGPSPAKPGKALFKISYSLGGTNITNALEARTATTGSIQPGESVKLVEKVKVLREVLSKRTIQTKIQAVSATDSAESDSAKVKIVLKP